MKAEELMRNDWVCIDNENAPRQVDWIRSGEVGLYWSQTVTPPYLKPIPLTPEILKKNGLVKRNDIDGSDFYYIKVLGGQYRFTISFWFYDEPVGGVKTLLKCWFEFNGGVNQIHKCNVLYVHELQHALRLCGIEKEIEP